MIQTSQLLVRLLESWCRSRLIFLHNKKSNSGGGFILEDTKRKNGYFALLFVGTLALWGIILSEFVMNVGLLSNYSITLLFVVLVISFVVLFVMTSIHLKKFDDTRTFVLRNFQIFIGAYMGIMIILNLLVMV